MSNYQVLFNGVTVEGRDTTGVEKALAGVRLDEASIKPALAAVLEGTDPPTDAIASRWYREQIAPVYLKRLLMRS